MATLNVEVRNSANQTVAGTVAREPTTATDAPSDRFIRITLLSAQLAAVLLVVHAFQLENRTFFTVLILASCGFVLSSVIPFRFRLTWFALLSIASIVVVMGPDAASVVLAVGVLLLVICHLPAAVVWRVLLVVVVGLALAGLRTFATAPPLANLAVPVVASMFMFRIALYLHAITRHRAGMTVTSGLSYFFMLPNVCFPLFPVVDNDTFRNSYFRNDEFAIYERGVRWIVRGVVHLLLYRIIAHEFVVGESWANDLGDVIRHVTTAFLLYLRVSGQFHIIVGMLHLFGFQLPETHHRYLLSSSLVDFWRRTNIYWKDFMVKCVFFPTYFRLRRRGAMTAMITSTVLVFIVTWALHSYQQYWLQGMPLLTGVDASFWAIFGVLMVVGTLREAAKPANPARDRRRWSLRRGLSVVGTVTLVTILWSLWVAESFGTWFYMWAQTRYSALEDWLLLGGILLFGVVGAGFRSGERSIANQTPRAAPLRRSMQWTAAIVLAAIAGYVVTRPAVQRAAPHQVARLIRDLRGEGIPIDQQARHLVGYYQRLEVRNEGALLEPWSVPDTAALWPIVALGYENRDGFLLKGLTPGLRKVVDGKTWSVNRWGMRDRDYDLIKTPDTYRIALIGPSVVLGWGVGDNEGFEPRVEAELDAIARSVGRRVEILNFSVPGWSVAQEVLAMSELAHPFSPDLILYSVHPFEMEILASKLLELLWRGETVPDPALAALIERTGIRWEMGELEIRRRLRVIEDQWNRRVAEWALETSSRLETPIAALLLRNVHHAGATTLKPPRRAIAAAGIPTLDCSSSYEGHDQADLWTSPHDDHPNALGHALLAHCLLDRLRGDPDLLPSWLRDQASSPSVAGSIRHGERLNDAPLNQASTVRVPQGT